MGASNTFIKYTDSFFHDVWNLCKISDYGYEKLKDVEFVYNTFGDLLEVDEESRIHCVREKMIALEYFKLFMSSLHALQMLFMHRMQEENPSDVKKHRELTALQSFESVVTAFVGCANSVKKSNKPEVWAELETHHTTVKCIVQSFLCNCYLYCFDGEDDKLPDPPPEITIPESTGIVFPDDEDEEEDDLEKQLNDQEILQCMERSKVRWKHEQIYMFCETCINCCAFIGYGFLICRLWVAILERSGEYDLDKKFIMYTGLLIMIQIISNFRSIFRTTRRICNG